MTAKNLGTLTIAEREALETMLLRNGNGLVLNETTVQFFRTGNFVVAVAFAEDRGVISGVGVSKFNPNDKRFNEQSGRMKALQRMVGRPQRAICGCR